MLTRRGPATSDPPLEFPFRIPRYEWEGGEEEKRRRGGEEKRRRGREGREVNVGYGTQEKEEERMYKRGRETGREKVRGGCVLCVGGAPLIP